MFEKVNTMLSQIKRDKPIVLNITNYVTMDFVANGLLSIGASPIMSKAQQELADLIKIANVVVINLGTLNSEFIALCLHACHLANNMGKPVVLDPVGAGASAYRTTACQQFLDDFRIAIIRGNASEIMALAGSKLLSKGVDSSTTSSNALASAKALAKHYQTTVVISGETDFIVDANQQIQFARGSALMPAITGTGCLLSTIVGAFHAVNPNAFDAASASSLFYSVCGEIAEKNAQGPGSFKTYFLDALYTEPKREHYEI
ncbi:MAG: hydroxyethylthiazole kinase [Pseudomonadota bacterium]